MQYSGLYTASGKESRLAALKSALNSFASAVANEEDDFGPVDNKVSIVGFSSPGYSNTELLTQKQQLLGDAIKATEDKLKTLKDASDQVAASMADGDEEE